MATVRVTPGTLNRAILSAAMKSDGSARESAVELINKFGRQGRYQYRDLFKP
jgi:hypothetical protein